MYGYSQNNPISRTDLLGLVSDEYLNAPSKKLPSENGTAALGALGLAAMYGIGIGLPEVGLPLWAHRAMAAGPSMVTGTSIATGLGGSTACGIHPANRAKGLMGEVFVRSVADIGQANLRIIVSGRTIIPDGVNQQLQTLSEVKNVNSLSFTRQLQDFVACAKVNNLQVDLYVRQGAGTYLTSTLLQLEHAGIIRIHRIIP